jgi:hypothetical protein
MMPKLFVAVIASVVMALGAAMPSVAASAAPAQGPTAQASVYNPCSAKLNPDRIQEYKLWNGLRALSFVHVKVGATLQYRHRYCVKFRTGGRTVTHSYSRADYVYKSGGCSSEQIGAKGSGVHQSDGYNLGLIVPDKTCVFMRFAVKLGGKWYKTKLILRWNA